MKPLETARAASSSSAAAPGDGQVTRVAQFTGALDDLSVADLIQILQLAGKSAAIVVTHEGDESRLWCAAGEIVDAESGRLRGEPAVHRILSFERGWMAADLRATSRMRSIFAGTQRLLLEAARRKDESVALREKLGSPRHCYRLADGLTLEQLGLSPLELCSLRSFAKPRSWPEALESSELGDFETLTALAAWVDAGYLIGAGLREAPLTPSAPPAPAARQSAAGTLPPLVASTRRGPPVRSRSSAMSWAWGAVVALVLTPAGYLLGSQTRHLPEPPAQLPAPAALAPAVEAPESYRVELRVEPPEAEIWLDREAAASGHLDTRLPRDGAPHELRVEARGYLPLHVLFVDTPPPGELRLEPDPGPERPAPSPANVTAAVESTTAPAAGPAGGDAAKARKRPAPARAPVRREPPRQSLRARPHAALGGMREASARQSAAGHSNDPVVRLLD
ncbi:MAG: DUF4388 domain-containing protein [Deltaproteobacteria bacterium]